MPGKFSGKRIPSLTQLDSAIRAHSSAAFIKMPVRCQQPPGLSDSDRRTAAGSGVAIRKAGLVEELASLE